MSRLKEILDRHNFLKAKKITASLIKPIEFGSVLIGDGEPSNIIRGGIGKNDLNKGGEKISN